MRLSLIEMLKRCYKSNTFKYCMYIESQCQTIFSHFVLTGCLVFPLFFVASEPTKKRRRTREERARRRGATCPAAKTCQPRWNESVLRFTFTKSKKGGKEMGGKKVHTQKCKQVPHRPPFLRRTIGYIIHDSSQIIRTCLPNLI